MAREHYQDGRHLTPKKFIVSLVRASSKQVGLQSNLHCPYTEVIGIVVPNLLQGAPLSSWLNPLCQRGDLLKYKDWGLVKRGSNKDHL